MEPEEYEKKREEEIMRCVGKETKRGVLDKIERGV